MKFLNNMTFSRKLWALAWIFISIVSTLSFSSYYWMKKIGLEMEEIGNVQLPAVKSMAVIDMYHDGTRGVVMTGMVEYQLKGKSAVSAQLDELQEFDDNFQKEFKALAEMPLASETAEKIKAANAEVGAFVAVARQTLTHLSQGQEIEAKEQLEKFGHQFSVLEGKLEALGEVIEKNSAETLSLAIQHEQKALVINLAFTATGIILCFFVSWLLINGLTKNLEGIYLTLKQDAVQLKVISRELGEGSTKLGQSSEEQASSVQETASTLDEINSMIARGTENVEKAVQLGESSGQKAQEGGMAIKEMISAISDIKNANTEIMAQLTESNKQVAEICDVIKLISDKTKVINDIVFQTKLLSFNASVEAARAGEQGKGFAVVAEEVGNLAQNSGKASQEIFKILEESMNKVENIISEGQKRVSALIANGTERIESGMKVASRCELVLNEVLQDVHTIGSMISEINEFSREQKTGVQNISVAVNQLDQSAQSSAGLSRSLLETSVSLINGSENLEKAVGTLEAQIYERNKRKQQDFSNTAKVLEFPTNLGNNSKENRKQA